MSANNQVPALPPLGPIQDANVRSALQSLYTAWQIRNGQVGSGSARFLTEADVGTTINNYFSSAASYGSGGTSGSTPVQPIIDAVTNIVLNSKEWATLQEKITVIQTPDWLRDAMRLATQTQVQEISTIAARVGVAEAAIGRSDAARTSLERAVVESFKQLVANYGGNTALVTDVASAVSTYAASYANYATQLYASVGQVHSIAFEEAAEVRATIDGVLSGLYTLRFNTSTGRVTGMAIGVDSDSTGYTQSQIVFNADTFAIGGTSAGTSVVPFVVRTSNWVDASGVSHGPGVYMQDVKVTNATIDNLVVTTSLIAPNAVSGAGSGAGSSGIITLSGSRTAASVTDTLTGLPTGQLAKVVVMGTVSLYENGGSDLPVDAYAVVDGTTVGHAACTLGESKSLTVVGSATVGNGAHTYSLQISSSGKSLAYDADVTFWYGKR